MSNETILYFSPLNAGPTAILVSSSQNPDQPRSQALPSRLRKDPGWGWSRVTRISRGKLKLSLGRVAGERVW